MIRKTKNELETPVEFDELLARCHARIEFANKLINVFDSELEEKVISLRQAISLQDFESMHHFAHALKGSAGMVSAYQIAEQAGEMEKQCKVEDIAAVIESFPKLEQAVDQFKIWVVQHNEIG